MLPMIGIVLIWFFIMMRGPQKRQQARRQQMLSSLKKNDRVLTAGGILGIVADVRLDANEVVIKVDETSNTRIRVTLAPSPTCSATSRRMNEEEGLEHA